MVEYLSFGGGPPSLALLILNVWGQVEPKAELVVYADTGWEKSETDRLVPEYRDWSEEMGLEFITVQSKDGPLDQYVKERSVPIPVHTENAIGKRQCTDKWKIQPIEEYLHGRFGKVGLTAQLAMTWGETHRVRDPRVKRNKNRWPLIEKRLTRQDCVEIIKLAGLTVPPWSACVGCPFQSHGRWQQIASRWPADWDRAVEMDEFLRERAERDGKDPIWLHWSKKPLKGLYSKDQMAFPMDEAGDVVEACSDGNCFT